MVQVEGAATMRGDESKTIKVYGNKYAKEKNSIPAYERVLHTRAVTFTCQRCGTTVTEQRFPGPTPRYCSEVCAQEARREQTRWRVRRLRKKNALLRDL
jgi:hypothetical protein